MLAVRHHLSKLSHTWLLPLATFIGAPVSSASSLWPLSLLVGPFIATSCPSHHLHP